MATRAPSPEHAQFDAICSQLSEWEPLPTVVAKPVEAERDVDDEERTAPLDELILAGLVAPY
jgi:hypothetical protein